MNDQIVPEDVSPSFLLGDLFSTSNASEQIPHEEVMNALSRHHNCDWGELDPPDREANKAALVKGGRLFSSYRSSQNITFWIITEADRSRTTILLPLDY